MKRYLLYTDTKFKDPYISKTAHCLLRFQAQNIVGILDYEDDIGVNDQEINKLMDKYAIKHYTSAEAIMNDYSASEIDIVIGFAPIGGRLNQQQRDAIRLFCENEYCVINGLHDFIDDQHVKNLRYNDYPRIIAEDIDYGKRIILTVGTDHSIGKMTATVKLCEYLKQNRADVRWLATGQTGLILNDGIGHVIDAIPIDFVPGVIQNDLMSINSKTVIVEGQGSIFYPAYSPTSFALFHTCKPQQIILCHDAARKEGHFGNVLPSLSDAKQCYDSLASYLGFETKIIGISVNTSMLSNEDYLNYKAEIEDSLQTPCYDFLREVPIEIMKVISSFD